MDDYIKREDAKELLDMLLEHYHDTGVEVIKHTAAIAPKEFHISEEDDIADFNFEIDAWKKDFSNIPSADVAPIRHGRWEVIDAEEPRRYGCSECKRLSWYMENYCPNCGAKMDDCKYYDDDWCSGACDDCQRNPSYLERKDNENQQTHL